MSERLDQIKRELSAAIQAYLAGDVDAWQRALELQAKLQALLVLDRAGADTGASQSRNASPVTLDRAGADTGTATGKAETLQRCRYAGCTTITLADSGLCWRHRHVG